MKKYEAYKDSGVEWLGEIPEHWGPIKVAWLFDEIGSGTTPNTDNLAYYPTNGISWLQTGDLNDGDIFSTSKKISKEAVRDFKLKIYPPDSIVIAMYGATIAKLGYLKIETATNQACCVLSKSKKMNSKYSFYVFYASKQSLVNKSYGGGQPNISQSIIKKHIIPVPPYAEQIQITNYLDFKVNKINDLISAKQNQIEDLQKYRASLISETVTRGLNHNVEMKESGIEWIGMIPKHWEVNYLKRYADVQTGTTPSTKELKYWKNPTKNWYTPSDILDDIYLNESVRKVAGIAYEENACKVFPKGCVLIVGIGATLGKVGLSMSECSANQQINAVVFNDCIFPKYGAYYLYSGKEYMKSIANSATLPILNQSETKKLYIIIPPLSEQQEIADYLDKKIAKIESTINELKTQIEDLRKYKTSVISEAVTGKVDLRDWKPK